MKKGKISVIVPVYNVENYLHRCVDSILSQTYTNLEVLLVNDGSTDSSLEICREYAKKDKRVLVINKKNGGLSSARNAGLEAATGEYIGFVDSDDYIGIEMYSRLINAITDDHSIANVMLVRTFEDGTFKKSSVPRRKSVDLTPKEYLRDLLLHRGDTSAWTKLFPRSLIGNLHFQEGILNEDLLFMMELIDQISTVHFVGFVGYYYFVRNKSISNGYGKAVVDMVQNSLVVKERTLQLYPDLNQEAERLALYQHMAYLLLVPGKETRHNEVYKKAKKYVRDNVFRNLRNPYLTKKNKLTLLAQTVIPKFCARKYQKKHRQES